MTLAMVLLAMNGAATQVASTEGVWAKARMAAVLAYLFTKEIVGFAALLPSASRSFLLYSSLPSHPFSHLLRSSAIITTTTTNRMSASKSKRLRFLRPNLGWFAAFNVSVARDIPYGSAKRNLLDVYVPGAAVFERRQWPVVLFVHGGIWASGSKELFSHVGACLANYGVLAVVVQYTLFPQVLAWEQVREVSRALTWVFDNAEHYGGDPYRVTLMGHSAGAHLAALVVWERFKSRQQLWQRRAEAAHVSAMSEIDEEDLDEKDTRQPCNFVGLAGVYDIVEHLKYEQKRGVDTMSCMTPAMGGRHLVEAMSPVRLFHSVIGNASSTIQECCNCGSEGIGVDEDAHCSSSSSSSNANYRNYCGSEFPRCTLLCSSGDTVVPPDTSKALHAVLQEQLGLQSELRVFDNLRHGDFVILDGRLPELVSLRRHILCILQR